jgi:CubicO group peptidase (beta-lactamase class C family)
MVAAKMDDALVAPPPAFADPGRRDTLATGFAEVDRVVAEFQERERVPGVAYGVVVDGELAHQGGAGVRDTEGGAPADADSVFRIASMTKSLTAMCVLILRDEGRLSLDDPAVAHVPELTDDAWADRHLDAGDAEFSRWMEGGLAFTFPPGVEFEYSNVGYGVLGRVVSNVAGEPLRAFADERVLRPLGMSSTTWDAERISEDRVAKGYRLEDDAWVLEAPLADGALGAMGGLATTVRDYARYVALHLSAWPPRDDPDDGPLRRSSLREMQSIWRIGPTFMAEPDPDWGESSERWLSDGYGYGLTSGVHSLYGRVVAHSGGLPGFGSHVRWLPDHGVGVMVFANRTYGPAWAAVSGAFRALAATGGLEPRVPQPAPALAAARDAGLELYDRWDDAVITDLAADNLFLDAPLERRRRACADVRDECGSCESVDAPRLSGGLRGEWRMHCERGKVDLTVALSPTTPPRVQALQFDRVTD